MKHEVPVFFLQLKSPMITYNHSSAPFRQPLKEQAVPSQRFTRASSLPTHPTSCKSNTHSRNLKAPSRPRKSTAQGVLSLAPLLTALTSICNHRYTKRRKPTACELCEGRGHVHVPTTTPAGQCPARTSDDPNNAPGGNE